MAGAWWLLSTFILLGQASDPVFRFETGSFEVGENDTLLVRVQKIGPGAGSVHYATVDGTALAGWHYEAREGWLHFLSVETNKTLPFIRTGNDFLTNEPRRFTIVLSDPSAGSLGEGERQLLRQYAGSLLLEI